MADEFVETDLDTPTEHDVDEFTAPISWCGGYSDESPHRIPAGAERGGERPRHLPQKKVYLFLHRQAAGFERHQQNILVDALGKAPLVGLTPVSNP